MPVLFISFITTFVRIYKALRVTPTMEAKLTMKPMTIEDIVSLVPTEPKKRDPISGS
jgi:hypothetical protein